MINYNPMDLDAGRAYGVELANISQVPTSGVDVKEPSGMSTSTTAGNHVTLHWNNPLFWLLVLLLLFVGYIGFIFDFSLKRVGKIDVRGGSEK